MTARQRVLSSTVSFVVSWVLVAFVCTAFGMNDGDAAAYAAASAGCGLLLGEWWRIRGDSRHA